MNGDLGRIPEQMERLIAEVQVLASMMKTHQRELLERLDELQEALHGLKDGRP